MPVDRQIARHPASRRSLLDRPQRLGFLPTLWFWNDHERQRLLLPLILVTGLPFGALSFYITSRFGLSVWSSIASNIVYAILVQGLAERHIRKQLVALPLETRLTQAITPTAPPRISPALLPAALAMLAGSIVVLLTLGTVAAAVILGLAVGGSILGLRASRRPKQLGPAESAPEQLAPGDPPPDP